MRSIVLSAWMALGFLPLAEVGAAEVSGQVEMPEVCSPAVSPAVVTLEPAGAPAASAKASAKGAERAGRAEVALIDQRGLQFVPRVQAMPLGGAVRFANGDSETHNVHVLSAGEAFNESMAPGQAREFTPSKPGIIRLGCDVHSHMRGFVVVADTPWVRACSRRGAFRFAGVPEGRYVVSVWHEMGEPIRRDVTVAGNSVELAPLRLSATVATAGPRASAPVRPWADVVDRIGVAFASSLDAAGRPAEKARARRLAEDAYWGEFEASEMETAVRSTLGFARSGELERQFYAVIRDVRAVAAGSKPPAQAAGSIRRLLLDLAHTSDELNRRGVTDRTHLFAAAASPSADSPAAQAIDQNARLLALAAGFGRVRSLADAGEAADAASEMMDVYFKEFEPIETFVAAHRPAEKSRLELAFYAIRGEVASGVRGDALAERLAGFRAEVEHSLGVAAAQPSGTFGPAFAASLITILREGVEVILILTMLLSLVAKAGQGRGRRAIWGGVGAAVLASVATAAGLNLLVSSAHGRAREGLEGLVMLVAAGLLFYVSYWLISQVESRRWLDFLKRQAARGVELGGAGSLALTAFLAVYREGAETALMYQAMIGSQGGARPGLLGLAAGLGVGLVLLAGVAAVIRAGSLRLPLRTFFRLTGLVLFAMAVVFAGNGVFELQQSGVLRTTTLAGVASWLGRGVPVLGLYPNVQTLSVQGLLLAGAALALVVLTLDQEAPAGRGVPAAKARA